MNIPQPAPLPDVPPQPVDDGHLPVEGWLQERLVHQFDEANHAPYEYSLYGPINALLLSQFPLARRFLVKPQASLRATIEPYQFAPQEANTSGGTLGTAVPILPDFVVVRANERLYNDWILCIIEVKREGENLTAAELQLSHYLERASNERWKVGLLGAFVIIGSHCYSYRYDEMLPEALDCTDLGATDGVAFKQALYNISKRYWGNTSPEWMLDNFVGPYE